MNKSTLIITATIAILCLIIGYGINDYISNKTAETLEEGFNQGTTAIITQIGNTGNIPLITNNTVQWYPLQQLCSEN